MPKKVDANQPQLVADLRRCGLLVHVTSDLGRGFPDIVVGVPWNLKILLCEVKNPEERWKLTEKEEKFHELWNGLIHIIETTEDALRLLGY